ncbi:hypothetical protein RJT34_05018 [Clitoria ternatea]|uniref:F-box domain-containing protein n=1 Tax=Clitoria ternatea TaxID=43366 RepID=A0AAN9K0Z2_CLITE
MFPFNVFLLRISTVVLYHSKNGSKPRLLSMALLREKVRIPDDLIFCVLAKLSLKSLKRFECVHKSWVNILENPYFLSMYRNNITSKYDSINNSSVLLKQFSVSESPDKLFLLSGNAFENKRKLDWPTPFQEEKFVFILSSTVVHGMICVHQGDFRASGLEIPHKIMLWNLTTQQFQLLPSLHIEDCPLGWQISAKVHGFGYDCLTDDYKVIQCTYYCDPPKGGILWYIYSLRSNSWRKLDIDMPPKVLESSGFTLYLNGVCHWWGWISPENWGKAQLYLVSFNLYNEVVVTTHMPFLWGKNRCYTDHYLDELNGSIIDIKHDLDAKTIDIFVLGELGVKESWTKLFTFSPLPFPGVFIGVTKKRGIVVFLGYEYQDEEITRFDLRTQVVQEVGIKGFAPYCQVETIPGIDI